MSTTGNILEFDFEGDIPMAGPSIDNSTHDKAHISINLADKLTPLEDANVARELGDNDLMDAKVFKDLVHRQDMVDSNFAKLNTNLNYLTEMVKAYFDKHDPPVFARHVPSPAPPSLRSHGLKGAPGSSAGHRPSKKSKTPI